MSLVRQEYYGNPQNHFWPVMEALFGVDRAAPFGERKAALLARGVAVWDVIAECSREGSGDDKIQHAVANPVIPLLKNHPAIRRVFFNGGMAYRTARLLLPGIVRPVGGRVRANAFDEPAQRADAAGGEGGGVGADQGLADGAGPDWACVDSYRLLVRGVSWRRK